METQQPKSVLVYDEEDQRYYSFEVGKRYKPKEDFGTVVNIVEVVSLSKLEIYFSTKRKITFVDHKFVIYE